MTTEAQIEANRANAQKSTGPRTPEGKARVAQNAIKHGLLARQVAVVGEEVEDFALFRDELRAELAPVGLVEARLVARIADLMWRLQRAERFHAESFDVMYARCFVDPQVRRRWPGARRPDEADPIVGETVVKDFSETKVLERLMVYERRIEGSLCRMMAELRNVQGQRQAAAAGASTKGSVRDPRPTDLSRPDQDRLRRRSGRGREVPPLDFALDNLLAKIIAVQGKRADPTANTPAQQSCQTKPIEEDVASVKCEVLSEEGHAVSPGSLPTSDFKLQTSGPAPTVQGETCETNPICSGGSSRQGRYTPIFRRRR